MDYGPLLWDKVLTNLGVLIKDCQVHSVHTLLAGGSAKFKYDFEQ